MKIALISCSKSKQNHPCAAAKMYAPSELFSLSYEYAKRTADRIFILSGKYGLLKEDTLIEPYQVTLADFSNEQRLSWAQAIARALEEECDLLEDEFIILAGKNYYEHLLPVLPKSHLPLKGMDLFQRTAFLRKTVQRLKETTALSVTPGDTPKDLCDELHRLFNSLDRYSWHDIRKVAFDNGIYVLFEKGERYKSWDRIVRVGTHTSPGRLRQRLYDHFLSPNKDGSIFRKNIGKALLNRSSHPYLSVWSLNTSHQENKRYVDPDFQKLVEEKVSAYLKANISFAVIPVEDAAQRLRLEEAIIASVHRNEQFGPGGDWLGRYSPEAEIRASGLWLKQGLLAPCLTEGELSRVLAIAPGRVRETMGPPLQTRIRKTEPLQSLASPDQDGASEKLWNRIRSALGQSPREFRTKRGLWFSAYSRDGALFVTKAHSQAPSCKISMERRITKEEFRRLYPYHDSWKKNHPGISQEMGAQSNNSSYVMALIDSYQ